MTGSLTGALSHGICPAFDWYRATVPAHHSLVLQALQAALSDGGVSYEVQPGKGRFNYLESTSLVDAGERLVTVLHGGPNGNPSVESSGDNAPALANFLRSTWIDHKPSRVDVAIDFKGSDLFNTMIALIHRFADTYRLNCTSVINRDKSKGDTYYLGSRSSAVFVRCYEKGKQLQSNTCGGVSIGLDDWVRLELEAKPLKPFRLSAARLEPAEFWGLADWTRKLVKEALSMDVEPIRMRPQRVADHERAMGFLASQYGPTLLRHLERMGGDQDRFLSDLLARIRGEGEYAEERGPRMIELRHQGVPTTGWRRAS